MKIDHRLLIVSIISVFTLFTIAPLAYGQSAPPRVDIEAIDGAGTGCQPDTFVTNVSEDRKAFTVAFSEYVASAGPGIPFTETRKNCNLVLNLDFPPGWSFSIFRVNYRGFAFLENNRVSATQRSSYFFEGDPRTVPLRTNFVGPLEENYTLTDTLGLETIVFSRCGGGRALNIGTEVRCNNFRDRRASCLMTNDTIDGEFTHTYGLIWRRCRPGQEDNIGEEL